MFLEQHKLFITTMALMSLTAATVSMAQDPPSVSSNAQEPIDWTQFSAGIDTPKYLRQEADFQSGKFCGPNAIYALLRILGRTDVSYKEVLTLIDVGEKGASLQDLVDGANSLGISCEAVKEVSPEALIRMPKPVVIHLYDYGTTADGNRTESKESATDHYDVVLGYDEASNRYAAIDTTNLRFTYLTGQAVARSMSGYCIRLTDGGILDGNSSSLIGTVFDTGAYVLVALLVIANVGFFINQRLTR